MAGFGRCKRHDEPELDCRVCIESETVAAIVAWLRERERCPSTPVAEDELRSVIRAIERGDWKRGR